MRKSGNFTICRRLSAMTGVIIQLESHDEDSSRLNCASFGRVNNFPPSLGEITYLLICTSKRYSLSSDRLNWLTLRCIWRGKRKPRRLAIAGIHRWKKAHGKSHWPDGLSPRSSLTLYPVFHSIYLYLVPSSLPSVTKQRRLSLRYAPSTCVNPFESLASVVEFKSHELANTPHNTLEVSSDDFYANNFFFYFALVMRNILFTIRNWKIKF